MDLAGADSMVVDLAGADSMVVDLAAADSMVADSMVAVTDTREDTPMDITTDTTTDTRMDTPTARTDTAGMGTAGIMDTGTIIIPGWLSQRELPSAPLLLTARPVAQTTSSTA